MKNSQINIKILTNILTTKYHKKFFETIRLHTDNAFINYDTIQTH